MYAQGKNGLGEIDWNSIFNNAVQAYGAYSAADTQKDILKLQLQQQQQQAAQLPFFNYSQNPAYSPVYGGTPGQQQFNFMPWLLIGGVALAAYFILKK